MWEKGLKRARGLNTDLKERHPCLRSLHARVFLEADWMLIVLSFGHDKIRNVTSRVLHGLHVEEYV